MYDDEGFVSDGGEGSVRGNDEMLSGGALAGAVEIVSALAGEPETVSSLAGELETVGALAGELETVSALAGKSPSHPAPSSAVGPSLTSSER